MGDPIGGVIEGKSFMVWVQSPQRFGAAHRSPLDLRDQAFAMALFGLPTHAALVAPYDLLHDMSDVEVVDRSVFGYVSSFVTQFADVLAARTRRLAVVRPTDGLAGAAIAGLFHDWVLPRFDAKLCASRREAYAFLAVPAADRHALEELYASFTQPELVRKLHAALALDLQHATLDRVAAALVVSTRSLQRRISECGTKFSAELARVRVQAAEALLVQHATKIEAIAREVGFRSAPAFTAAFRRINGMSPSAYREAHAGTGRS